MHTTHSAKKHQIDTVHTKKIGFSYLVTRNGVQQQLGLVRRHWVDQAGGALIHEYVVQARLVAADAGVDLVRTALRSLKK